MQIDLASVVAWDFRRLSKPQQSETELIRAIARGDKHAMHVLFSKHRLGVYRFALGPQFIENDKIRIAAGGPCISLLQVQDGL